MVEHDNKQECSIDEVIKDYLETSLDLCMIQDCIENRKKLFAYFEVCFDMRMLLVYPYLFMENDSKLGFAIKLLKNVSINDENFYKKLENIINWQPDKGFLRGI